MENPYTRSFSDEWGTQRHLFWWYVYFLNGECFELKTARKGTHTYCAVRLSPSLLFLLQKLRTRLFSHEVYEAIRWAVREQIPIWRRYARSSRRLWSPRRRRCCSPFIYRGTRRWAESLQSCFKCPSFPPWVELMKFMIASRLWATASLNHYDFETT
jgi:hypothetical protein